MKSFRFPLEVVLEARRARESEAGRQLATALAKQLEAAARSQEALRALNQLLQTIAEASAGRFSAAERDRFWGMRRVQETVCAELRAAAQECGRRTEEQRAHVLQARRDRELLEQLKERQQQAWRKDAERAEQHLFDEFAMTRRHQAAQQAYCVC